MHKATHRSDKEALTEIDSINRSHSRWSDHYAYRNIPFTLKIINVQTYGVCFTIN